MTVALFVTYPATPGAKFDRDYYVATHIPLVKEKWTRHGLTEANAMFPDAPDADILGSALLLFRDAGARDAALGSPEAAEVFGDVPNFTDLQPAAMPMTVA